MTVEVTIVSLAGESLRALALASLPDLPGPIQLRARAIVDEDVRCQFILCHKAVLLLARRANGGRAVALSHSPSGKPRLTPGPHLSLSRASGYAAIAFCQAQEIGIDIADAASERGWMSASRYPGLADRLRRQGGTGKREVLRAWTELEAVAKLWQEPMQRLLDGHLPLPSALAVLSGHGLLLTVATAREAVIELSSARWTDDGDLHVASLCRVMSSVGGKANCEVEFPSLA